MYKRTEKAAVQCLVLTLLPVHNSSAPRIASASATLQTSLQTLLHVFVHLQLLQMPWPICKHAYAFTTVGLTQSDMYSWEKGTEPYNDIVAVWETRDCFSDGDCFLAVDGQSQQPRQYGRLHRLYSYRLNQPD